MRKPTHEEAIEHIINSGTIKRGSRQDKLLTFLLSKSAGEAKALGETHIVKAIWNKSESFDPKHNSIVRTEMHRLRQKLKTFNAKYAKQYGFTVESPPRSYQIILRPLGRHKTDAKAAPSAANAANKIKPEATITLKYSTVILLFLMQIAILSIIAIGLMIKQRPPPQLTSYISVLPSLKLASPDTDNESTNRLHENFKTQFMDSTQGYVLINYKQTGTTDFTLTFDGMGPALEAGDEISVQLYDLENEMLWSKQYPVELTPTGHIDIDGLVYDLTDDLYWTEGLIRTHYKKSSRLPPEVMDIYLCMSDMMDVWGLGEMYHYKTSEDLLRCSDTDLAIDPKTRSYIHMLRGKLYMTFFKGYINLPISKEEAFLRAEYEIEQSFLLGNISASYYASLIALERERRPQRDLIVLNDIITRAQTLYPNDVNLKNDILNTRGFFMGHWDQVQKIVEQDIEGLPSANFTYFTLLAAALATDDENTLRRAYANLPPTTLKIYQVFRAAAACRINQHEDFTKSRAALRKQDIVYHRDFSKFVYNRNYDPKISQALIENTQPTQCNLFYN